MRLSYRQLQVKVEELTEERSLQSSAATSTSLLSEIEQSMEAEELEQEREQVLMPHRSSTRDCLGTSGARQPSLVQFLWFQLQPGKGLWPCACVSPGLLAGAVMKQALTGACPWLTVTQCLLGNACRLILSLMPLALTGL